MKIDNENLSTLKNTYFFKRVYVVEKIQKIMHPRNLASSKPIFSPI